ncbi:DeoD-type purine-nucleoside phosphorylase [Nocardioides sp. B-3]|uniref:purine-nucleoside phosphorylase n=1 Tax=Nocardioides sp. B-3 TaxID=2895565 RepID=UPI0021525EFC|nr:DeoD-type purine-nucleoside phosphorylase [Nocardioides sp. B-3]UUZ58184.1 DeoD-type purine-nucleoside phosphorylase [Nocardioides sp. B-3]
MHEHPHRRHPRRDRPRRPDARRPAAGEVDRGDLPRRRQVLQRGPRHVRLHRLWRGQRVSVQGSGMGQPSLAIYVNELFRDYDVESIIRVGSCGAVTEKVAVRDVILASGACTDSSMNTHRFGGYDYAPVADFGLLSRAYAAALALPDTTTHVGLIMSSDSFYSPRPELMKPMVEHGVLAIEMEASALYTLAAANGRKAPAVCTVSDHIVTGEETTSAEREQTFGAMIDIALTAALA